MNGWESSGDWNGNMKQERDEEGIQEGHLNLKAMWKPNAEGAS